LGAQAAVKRKLSEPQLEMKSTLTAYLQLDVLAPAGTMTVLKRAWEVAKCDSACIADAYQVVK
jgi:predicted nucleic acid-binding protein